MLRSLILIIIIIPISIFAFSYNLNYQEGYLHLTFFDATSIVKIYINDEESLTTSLNDVDFFVGKKSFVLKIFYRDKVYKVFVGQNPKCNLILISKTPTTLTYNLNFRDPFDSPPKIKIYAGNIQIFYSSNIISNNLIRITIPVPNAVNYLKFYVEDYILEYDGEITDNIPIDAKKISLDFSAYTDFNDSDYWITIAARYSGYFNGKPTVELVSKDATINISRYFTSKFHYVFGTYRYFKNSIKDGEYSLVVGLGDFTKKYRVFIYKSLAFFPDIHRQISAEISKIYTVKPGDTLYYIAVNNNTDVQSLVKINGFEDSDNIKAGERILIGKVRFAPSPDTIIISEGNSRLYFFHNRKLIGSFFSSPGVKGKTPLGKFQIIRKIKNPTLYWEGEIIPPLSPINGLGTRFLQLSDPQYGIHGTTKPWEIGRRVSHGCIRMMNSSVENIFNLVQVGTNVYILRNFSSLSKVAIDRIFNFYKLYKFVRKEEKHD
jgi:lipoprotein-anchoring transpeptidase ErfK/SrfK